MASKLFFICPDCNSEYFIHHMYGKEVCFISALGASFPFHNGDYMRSVGSFIKREAVEEIYIAHSVHCRFMKPADFNKAIAGEVSGRKTIFPFFLTSNQRKQSAALHIHRQMENLYMYRALLGNGPQAKITINGLLLDHNKGKLIRRETFTPSFFGCKRSDLN